MTKDERQQSLANARLACEWLTDYLFWKGASVQLRQHVEYLVDGFKLLDAGEQKRNAAGRKFGKLGAKHGKKGGRPRKAVKEKK